MRSTYQTSLAQQKAQLANEKWYAESQPLFRTLFEQSPFGNKIISSELRIIKVNKALQQMLWYSEQELVGTKSTNHAHPDPLQDWQALQEKLWQEEISSFQLEGSLIKKDGSPLWCSVTTVLFEDNDTTLGYTLLEDITERKILVEKLTSSESMLTQSQQAAGVGSFIADLQTGMVHCSPALNRIFGLLEAEKFIHKDTFFSVFDAASQQRHEQLLAKAIAQVSSYTSEYKLLVEGQEKWVWEKGQVQQDGEGNLTISGVAQSNDSETLQLLLGIIHGSTNMVTVAKPVRDKEGRILDLRYVLFNNTAKKYMGAPEDAEYVIGKTLTELFPATRRNGNLERYIDTIENNKKYKGIEYFYPHEGMNHWFSESAYCFGEYIVITLDDITERKHHEEKLRSSEALLLESQEIAQMGSFI